MFQRVSYPSTPGDGQHVFLEILLHIASSWTRHGDLLLPASFECLLLWVLQHHVVRSLTDSVFSLVVAYWRQNKETFDVEQTVHRGSKSGVGNILRDPPFVSALDWSHQEIEMEMPLSCIQGSLLKGRQSPPEVRGSSKDCFFFFYRIDIQLGLTTVCSYCLPPATSAAPCRSCSTSGRSWSIKINPPTNRRPRCRYPLQW